MKYKYLKRVDDEVSNEQLNKLGEEGWKLISVVPSGRGKACNEYYFIKEITEEYSVSGWPR
jgi:hypothetical protein